jgi:hypothetical protein
MSQPAQLDKTSSSVIGSPLRVRPSSFLAIVILPQAAVDTSCASASRESPTPSVPSPHQDDDLQQGRAARRAHQCHVWGRFFATLGYQTCAPPVCRGRGDQKA